MTSIKTWAANRITQLLGAEDEVLQGFVAEMLDQGEPRRVPCRFSSTFYIAAGAGGRVPAPARATERFGSAARVEPSCTAAARR